MMNILPIIGNFRQSLKLKVSDKAYLLKCTGVLFLFSYRTTTTKVITRQNFGLRCLHSTLSFNNFHYLIYAIPRISCIAYRSFHLHYVVDLPE